MKIELPLNSLGGWEVVPGEIVDVAPHLSSISTFAVHHDLDAKRKWRVSEIESGCNIGTRHIFPTRGKAIAHAKERLKSISIQKMIATRLKKSRRPRPYQQFA